MSDTSTASTSEATKQKIELTVLTFKQGPSYVSQCLEYDVAAQGPTEKDCQLRFFRTLSAQLVADNANGRPPLSTLGPAPREYFDKQLMFHASSPDFAVYVPADMKLRATARFLTEGSESVSLRG